MNVRTPLALALLIATATPAAPEIYRLELAAGTSFETRYPPLADPEAPERILLLTDAGNWIALPRSIVRRVAVDTEERGFGRRLDALTVGVGPAMNDAPPGGGVTGSPSPPDALTLLARLFERRFEALPGARVEQFVEPEQAGETPLRYTLEALPAVGAATRFLTPQDRP